MRVFIFACEGQYQGLHGINNMQCIEVNNLEEANELGLEMASGVIDSYGLRDEFLEKNTEDVKNYDEWYGTEWEIYEIKDEVTLSIDELDSLCAKYGRDLFIEEYCKSEAL